MRTQRFLLLAAALLLLPTLASAAPAALAPPAAQLRLRPSPRRPSRRSPPSSPRSATLRRLRPLRPPRSRRRTAAGRTSAPSRSGTPATSSASSTIMGRSWAWNAVATARRSATAAASLSAAEPRRSPVQAAPWPALPLWWAAVYHLAMRKSRLGRRLFFALAGGLLLLSNASAREVTGSGPSQVVAKIVNGLETHLYPSVGMLVTGDGSLCSGILVGCQTFLTAAHCICTIPGVVALDGAECNARPDRLDPARFRVFFQHAGVFQVSAVAVNPSYLPDSASDLALLRLASPVDGITPTAINTTAKPAFGTAGTIVGFGATAVELQNGGIKRVGRLRPRPAPGRPTLSRSAGISPRRWGRRERMPISVEAIRGDRSLLPRTPERSSWRAWPRSSTAVCRRARRSIPMCSETAPGSRRRRVRI